METRPNVIRQLIDQLRSSENKLEAEYIGNQAYFDDIKEAYAGAYALLDNLLKSLEEYYSPEWLKSVSALNRYVNDSLPCHDDHILVISGLAKKLTNGSNYKENLK